MSNALNLIQEANSIPEFSCPQGACPSAAHLLAYLKKLKIRRIFSSVTDPRQKKVTYSLESLIQTAMATVLFRMGSKNAFHQEGRSSEDTEATIAQFVGIESGELPAVRTIDDVIKKLDHEELNEVLMSVFEVLRKDKFFLTIQC